MVQVINDLMKKWDVINQFLKTIKLEDWTKKQILIMERCSLPNIFLIHPWIQHILVEER